MAETFSPFSDQIARAKEVEKAPDTTTALKFSTSALSIRHRGCFITGCSLTEPTSGNSVSILHSDPNLEAPKLTASHVMSPIGPNEGIGGQHGFPRWADYQEFTQRDGPNGEKRTSLQAKRSDLGLGLIKTFELIDNLLTSSTTLLNSESEATSTSLGEHYYFTLEGERSSGLMVNGRSLDELLGKGSEEKIMAGTPIFWPSFEGEVIIDFPAGHSVKLSANAEGVDESKLGMLFWHRPESESICFEPTLGFNEDGQNNGVSINSYESVTLNTKIELLASKDSSAVDTDRSPLLVEMEVKELELLTLSHEIANILREIGEESGFDPETCDEIARMTFEEAFETAYGYLNQAGLDAEEILGHFMEDQK